MPKLNAESLQRKAMMDRLPPAKPMPLELRAPITPQELMHLMAINAELVAALQDAALWLHDATPDTAGGDLLVTIRAAIAKATQST